MKHILLFLTLCFSIFSVTAQNFDVKPIKLSGDTNKRINLVILSEGYQETEFDKFETDATKFMNSMFSQSPFAEYADYFNIYIIKVPSNESGSDHPGTATDVTEPASAITTVDTYFNTSYDSYNIHRLLYSSDYVTISNVLANNFPEYDQTIVLVNSNVYGGSGGAFPFASTGASADEIAIHELGHSLFDLKDEYYPGDALAAEAINMTQETNTNLVKWKNWIGVNNVGIYQYGNSGTAATWHRPHQNCKMRYLGYPFCSVCKEGMIEKIHDLVSPIDAYTPVSNTVDNPSLPIDFQLNLIKPSPNTLETQWTLNSANFANNVDDVSLVETDLIEGENTLTTVVSDATTFLRVDNHETIHVYTVSWTINYSTLGVEDIKSSVNNLTVSMYPNPTHSILNFNFENSNNQNLKVDIIGIGGKQLKSLYVSNYENQKIDISNLMSGVYLVNFYANNVLVATKKLVKN